MPHHTPTAVEVANKLQAGTGLSTLVDQLYQELGHLDRPVAIDLRDAMPGVALVVRPRSSPLAALDDHVFLADEVP